jgi:hypothetical protein
MAEPALGKGGVSCGRQITRGVLCLSQTFPTPVATTSGTGIGRQRFDLVGFVISVGKSVVKRRCVLDLGRRYLLSLHVLTAELDRRRARLRSKKR